MDISNPMQCLIGNFNIQDKIYLNNINEIEKMARYYEIPFHIRKNEKSKNSYQDIYDKNINAIKRLDNEISVISEELSKNKILYCIMVGIPFAKRYFDCFYLRLQEDIDFFIDYNDYVRVCNIMGKLGYYKYGASPSETKKHQTFIKKGFSASDSTLKGKYMVKFYINLTDINFANVVFSDISNYIEDYKGYKVLSPEAQLFHLILHAHYYDMHPKCLADIFMLCKNATINYDKVIELCEKHKVIRIGSIILQIMNNYYEVSNLSVEQIKKLDFINTERCVNTLMSRVWWEKIFTFLSAEEMTLWRCYMADNNNYKSLYSKILDKNNQRRVSSRNPGFIIGC